MASDRPGQQCRFCRLGTPVDDKPGTYECAFNLCEVVEADVPHCAAQELTPDGWVESGYKRSVFGINNWQKIQNL